MLRMIQIDKSFNIGTINEKQIFQGLNLTINDGDFLTVIGGNGAGKSTMLNLIAGVHKADGGRIILDGEDLTDKNETQRARYIGRVFQDPMMGTAPTMMIEENLAMAYRRTKRRTLAWGISQKERELYRDSLSQLGLGLEDRLKTIVGLLSGSYPAHGDIAEAKASAAGRAYRGARPGNLREGAAAQRPDHPRPPAHSAHGHPQYAGRHHLRQPTGDDGQRQNHSRYQRGRKEKIND